MITPVEYRISCDSGNACKGKIMMHRLIPNRATVRATSTRDAAKRSAVRAGFAAAATIT